MEVKRNEKLHYTPSSLSLLDIPENLNMKNYNSVLTEELVTMFENSLKFPKLNERSIVWLQNKDYPCLIESLENLTNVAKEHFDNICFVRYPPKYTHRFHYDAFNTKQVDSKAKIQRMGQRMKTITGFLHDNVVYNFNKFGLKVTPERKSILLYDNTLKGSLDRDTRLSKSITNTGNSAVIMFHIYVCEKPRIY